MDFKAILKLKSMGLHHTKEGLQLINLILSQNNSRRLSTRGNTKVDRVCLYAKIEELLGGPSNYEVKEDGRVYIRSLNRYATGGKRKPLSLILEDKNGSIIHTFKTRNECAKFLGVDPVTVSRKFRTGSRASSPFLFKNQLVYLKMKDEE